MSDNGFTDLREQLTGELLDIRYIPLSQAVLWDENPKEHDLGALAEAFARYGFADPPKYDAQLGALVYGNGRTHALQLMHKGGEQPPRGVGVLPDGEWAIPVKFGVDAASRNEARAFAIDHNNLTMAGGEYTALDMSRMWDGDQYLAVLSDLAAQEVAAVTVDGDDLDFLLRELGEPVDPPPDPGAQVDRAAELQAQWQTARGQVWEVESKSVPGRSHRIMCGDSTSAEDVARLMAGEKADTLADPPYNVGLDYTAQTDDLREEEKYWEWQRLWFNTAQRFTEKQVVTPGCINLERWISEFSPKHIAVWDKGEGANTYGRVTKYWAWEPLMCHGQFKRERHTDVFRYSALGANPGHPCPKPIKLWVDIIENLIDGDVYDPFLGSGTTAVAAESNGRLCYGMEIAPEYTAVILQRLADMGLEPHLVEGS